MQPFLKWAGGKRWLAPVIAERYRRAGGRLVEPFAGSAAVFFEAVPNESLLADVNSDLMETYVAVRDDPLGVIAGLDGLDVDASTFAAMRAACPTTPLERAVRFIYLNRTAFNGLYRVNMRGQFNVPFGCKPGTRAADAQALLAASEALSGVRLSQADFRETLRQCDAGDFVYLDPPYTVAHNQNGFNRYNESLFAWDDQVALAAEAESLRQRGAIVVISNADHSSIRRLYPREAFVVRRVERSSRMAASSAHRGPATEVLITSRKVS